MRRGQNRQTCYLLLRRSGARPEYTIWGYSHGERGRGSGAKLLVSILGSKALEAENCLKIMWAILRSGFDYSTFLVLSYI